MNHDWWAVELRRVADSIDTLGLSSRHTRDAIDRVLELIEEGPDCDGCIEAWMDEAHEFDDFPEVLDEEHVVRILALEDAVLVRHALEQWLVALRARRSRRIEEERAKIEARGPTMVYVAEIPQDPEERPSARMRARSHRRG